MPMRLPTRRGWHGNSAATGGFNNTWLYTALGTPTFQLDFVNRRYYWGGAGHNEAEFSASGTGMTFGAHGMTVGADGYLRQTMAALGMTNADTAATVVCSIYVVTAAIASQDWVWTVSDGTNQEYHACQHATTPRLQFNTLDGGVSQVALANNGSISDVTKYAAGYSWVLNGVDWAFDTGAAAGPDGACTMPAVASAGHLTVGAAFNALGNLQQAAIGHMIGYNTNLSAANLATATTYLHGLQA